MPSSYEKHNSCNVRNLSKKWGRGGGCIGPFPTPMQLAVGSYAVITNMIIEEKGEKLDCWLIGEHTPTWPWPMHKAANKYLWVFC